jgi:glycogen operon protein
MCWDHGGDASQQIQAVRTALGILLVSAGVPLLTGGSEFFRTQFGNNNAFNLDTTANWLDWHAAAQQAPLTDFARQLMQFRRAHPCLRPAQFFSGVDYNGNGLKDLTWYTDSGAEVSQQYFSNPENHFLAFRIDGTEFGDPAASLYVAYNGWINAITAVIPAPLPGRNWRVVADTSSFAEQWGNIYPAGQEVPVSGSQYIVNGRSLILLIER